MSDNDLRDHLSGLFSDLSPSKGSEATPALSKGSEATPAPSKGSEATIVPEPDSETEARKAESLSLEERVIFDLVGGDAAGSNATLSFDRESPVAAPAAAEPEAAEPSLSAPVGPEGIGAWRVTLGKRSVSVLSVLLYGVIILGGVPLAFLLIRFVGRGAVDWSGFPLYLGLYTLAVVVTLAQWLFNSFLSKALQEAEGQRDEAFRSRTSLTDRVQRLAAANASLQKRALQLQTGAVITRAVVSILEQDGLIQEAVNLICDRFDFYYVGIYMVDKAGANTDEEWAVLQAGTGEAGAQMLAQGHRLKVDGASVVGRCIVSAQARIALDTTLAQDWLLYDDESTGPSEEAGRLDEALDTIEHNSLLPKTRSEIVLPLLSSGQSHTEKRRDVIGALDIHSVEREAFSEQDVSVFQMMADHVAAAIDNARAFTEIQDRLGELRRSRTREQRARLLSPRPIPLYERAQPGVSSLSGDVLSEIEQVVAQRRVVVQSSASDDGGKSTLVAPVALRDQVIGALGLQEVGEGRQWTDDEVALIEAVADQMALAIENARLLEDTRRRAEQEQVLNEMTARFTRSPDVSGLLRSAVRELGRLLPVEEVSVHVGPPDETSVASEDGEANHV
ncbi:MAG TPA: GAF domain-containing protein [Thermoflexia bacterium]|nr:GAF domain-containing protein [Thermoflexia bacterium]